MKKNFKFYITLWITKLVSIGLKILGRNATYYPGKLALKLCPDFMGMLDKPKTIIGVTGTNGKTTVSNMINDILIDNGYKIVNNKYGSNIDAGIATTLIQGATLLGRTKKDIAILEIDERSSPKVFPYITPTYLICTNIFRDSLMRNAHTEFISEIVSKNVPKDTIMIENADDLICSGIAPNNKKIFFSIDKLDSDTKESHNIVRDIITCPKCNAKLEYEYYRYHHIGKAHCPKCDFCTPEADFVVKNIDIQNKSMKLQTPTGEQNFNLITDNIINIYNMLAAITVLEQLGLSEEQLNISFAKLKIVGTRFSEEIVNGVRIVTHLAKGINPIACSRAFEYVKNATGNKVAIVIVDDLHEEAKGSENTSWQYDTDYEFLNDDTIKQIIIAGPRYIDGKVRMLRAGVPQEKIFCKRDMIEATDKIKLEGIDGVYILHDLYSIQETNLIKQRVEDMIRERNKNHEN